MKLDQLRYFLEAARRQHIGKAAGILCISPSAVSHNIAELERELGRDLFVKKGRRLLLTHHGRLLMERTQALMEQLDALKDEMASEQTELRGHCRLAATHWLCPHFMAPAWAAVQGGNPRLTAELHSLRSTQVIAGVSSGEYDLGLCFNPQSHSSFDIRPVYEGRLVVAVRKGHPILRQAAPLKALSRYPAALSRAFFGMDNCETHPVFEKFGIVPRGTFISDSYETDAAVILATDTWGFFPDWIVKAYPGLKALPVPNGWDAPVRVALLWPKHRPVSKALERLAVEIKGLFSKLGVG